MPTAKFDSCLNFLAVTRNEVGELAQRTWLLSWEWVKLAVWLEKSCQRDVLSYSS
jgi:hypothetical protein